MAFLYVFFFNQVFKVKAQFVSVLSVIIYTIAYSSVQYSFAVYSFVMCVCVCVYIYIWKLSVFFTVSTGLAEDFQNPLDFSRSAPTFHLIVNASHH